MNLQRIHNYVTGNASIDAENFLNNTQQNDSYSGPKLITIDFNGQDNLKIYDEATNGIVFNDGTKLYSKDFQLSFNPSKSANATYKGFNGKQMINFSISSYEVTLSNVRALIIHEAYGHGVKNYGDNLKNHYKCYQASIDSLYWKDTTYNFKHHTVTQMWSYFYREVGFKRMTEKYMVEYEKYKNPKF